MKFLLSGLPGDAEESSVAEAMAKLGPVTQVTLVREGDPDSPWAIVEMEVTHERALAIKEQVNNIRYKGQTISLNLLIR